MIGRTSTETWGADGASESRGSSSPDPSSDRRATDPRDALLPRLTACHEAAHAIAAYHLRFPYLGVLAKPPRDGRLDESDFQIDLEAYQIGLKFLDGLRGSHRGAVVSICTVWAIARHVHVRLNGLTGDEADLCSSRDRTQALAFLRKQKLTDERRRMLWEEANQASQRIILLKGFRRALEATANRLLAEKSLTARDVEQTIEEAAGARLQGAWREPTHDEIALAAYLLHERRPVRDQVGDWLLAERGVRFGIACYNS
ncbi:MAG TPA: hypothetical protein VGE52_11620 [Pirellulales bacterium]